MSFPVWSNGCLRGLLGILFLATAISERSHAQLENAIGTTAGQFEVDDDGAATYTIPITVPPGMAGMKPELAITYSSDSGYGPLGTGFSLDGFSEIRRCGRTLARDGIRDGVDFDADDQFCLDGRRLVRTAAATWRPEIEDFSLVQGVGSDLDPASFTVKTKAGLIMTYGATADSRVVAQGRSDGKALAWMLSRVADSSGNAMAWTYARDPASGQVYPVSVDYAYASGMPRARVLFKFENLPVQAFSYMAGTREATAKVLTSITTQVFGSAYTNVRSYILAYDGAGQVGRARLASVMECGHVYPERCLPATRFTWSSAAPQPHATRPAPGYLIGDGLQSEGNGIARASFGDFDADGRTDLYVINSRSGIQQASSIHLARAGGDFETWSGPVHEVGPNDDVGVDISRVKIADLDGDGYSDVIRINGTSTPLPASIYINDRTGGFRAPVAGPSQRVNMGEFLGYRDTARMRFGDFNGDGVTDIAIVDGTNATRPIAIHLNNRLGTAFTLQAGPIVSIPDGFKSSSCAVEGVKLGDFDGDGLTDFYVIAYSGSGSALRNGVTHFNNGNGTWRSVAGLQHAVSSDADDCAFGVGSVVAADMNGDGLTDLVNITPVRAATRPMTIWYSRGDGTFDTAPGPNHTVMSNISKAITDQGRVKIGDFNGDGLGDFLILTGSNSSTSRLLLNRGFVSNGVAQFSESPGPAFYVRSNDHAENDVRRVTPADFDGSGAHQAIRIDACCDRAITSTVTSFGLQPAADRLITVRNGFGSEIAITYKPLTDVSVYRRTMPAAAAWPVMDVSGPAYVVSKHSQTDGVGGTRLVTYRYEDARTYLDGRGMAGFRSWSSFDQASDSRELRVMQQTYPWQGLPSRVERRIGNCLIASSQTQYDQKLLPAGRVFAYARVITDTDHEFNSCGAGSPVVSSKVSEYEYDEAASVFHGNLTRNTVRNYPGPPGAAAPMNATTTRHQYLDNEAAWHLGRLVRTDVTRESGGTIATRTSSFEYDPVSGLLSAETVEPDGPVDIRQRTEYTRNANGTIASTRVRGSADAGQDRVSRTAYDNVGLFPAKTYNALNHVVSVAVRPETGAPWSSTDAIGRVTQVAYDTFGRQIYVLRPDATNMHTVLKWCDASLVPACAPRAVLRTENLGSDGSRTWRDLDVLEREVGGGRVGMDGSPIVWFTEFNARGEVARRSVPAFVGDPVYWTTYDYDAVGRVVAESAPRNQGGGSRTTRFEYNGLATTQVDPKGNRTTRMVDALGRLQRVTDAAGSATTFRYDAFDNLVATVDARGNEIVATFDIRGRKLSTQDPDLGSWTYRYNGFGDLVWQRDAKGATQTLTYDALGRTTSRVEPEGTTAWTWDTVSKGSLTRVSAPGGYVRSHTYDSLGRPAQTTETIGGVSFTFDRAYDNKGRLSLLQYPGGAGVRYLYNAVGYLDSLVGTDQSVYWRGVAQDALGNWTWYRTGNNVETLRSHDQANGWIQTLLSGFGSASSANVQSLNFFWDDNGNLAKRVDQLQGGMYESFTYDALDRLRSSRVFPASGTAEPQITYAYDAIGNIVSRSDVGTYAYAGPRPHAVTATAGVASRASAYTYDANGNQLTGLGRTLEWTSFNLPSRVTQGTGRISYTYGPERQLLRALSVLPSTDLSADDVLYAGGGLYQQHRRGSTVTHRYLIQGGGQTIGMLIAGSEAAATKAVEYFHRDHLDSVGIITRADAVDERHSFDAFGKRRQTSWRSDPGDTLLQTTHDVDSGFTGHEHADHVGLIHMGGRVYDPILGRFTGPDPFVQFPDNTQSYNRYSYVLNNPLSNTDPSGFFLKRIKRELRRWERDFRHEIRRPDSLLGTGVRVVGSVGALSCGKAYVACAAGVEAATSRAQGLKGSGLMQNTAIAAGAAYGFNYVGNEFAAGSFSNVVGHGVVGGLSSLAGGSGFGPGFLAGAVSGWGGAFVPDSAAMGALASAVIGGTASEIGGGKFANGAVTGAFGHLFNKCYHGACDSELEQAMYDWWPGYKFGTGISNVMDGGEMTGWEMLDGASVGLGSTATGIKLAFSGGARSVFWSGYERGALDIARTLGVTLDKTVGGRLMNWIEYDAKLFRFSPKSWDWASAMFARNATGRATAVILEQRPTWLNVERPILRARGVPIDYVE